jgi:cytosine/adenosine deaminase-related metal-dependent hydrolase
MSMRHLAFGLLLIPVFVAAQRGGPPRPITIHSTHVLDGRGADLGEATITVEDGKITRVDRGASSAPATYDLGSATVMPGLIDAHVHLNWYFNSQGRYHSGGDGDTPAQSLLAMLENGNATLRAGVTTIQSPGAAVDTILRQWYGAGTLPGPRVLTSLNPLSPNATTPDSVLRAQVRQRKAQGADLIKVFASGELGGPSHDRARAQLGERPDDDPRRLHADRARRLHHRRRSQAHGREGHVFRSADLSRLPELSRQPRQVRGHRQLQ